MEEEIKTMPNKIRVITPKSCYEVITDEGFVEFVINGMVRRYRYDNDKNALILDKDWHKEEGIF